MNSRFSFANVPDSTNSGFCVREAVVSDGFDRKKKYLRGCPNVNVCSSIYELFHPKGMILASSGACKHAFFDNYEPQHDRNSTLMLMSAPARINSATLGASFSLAAMSSSRSTGASPSAGVHIM
jgi:hypothetical protein